MNCRKPSTQLRRTSGSASTRRRVSLGNANRGVESRSVRPPLRCRQHPGYLRPMIGLFVLFWATHRSGSVSRGSVVVVLGMRGKLWGSTMCLVIRHSSALSDSTPRHFKPLHRVKNIRQVRRLSARLGKLLEA
ncbi:hypothetical protein LA080_010387 [Diaporthe eres]|nr:hypothetical protein LA080_010387 [Diaporthe eres]